MTPSLWQIVAGAGFLAFNAAWVGVNGSSLRKRYRAADIPASLMLVWGTLLAGATALYMGSHLVPGVEAGLLEVMQGTGLAGVLVPLVSLGWISALIDARIRVLPTSITKVMGIEVLLAWMINTLMLFSSTTFDPSRIFLGPVVGAAVWGIAVGIGYAKDSVGRGDMLLGPVLGFALGSSSVAVAVVGLVLAFAGAGLIGFVKSARGEGRTARFPLGPYLLAGTWLAFGLEVVGSYVAI